MAAAASDPTPIKKPGPDDAVPEAVEALKKLGEFEGMDVVALSIVIKKAGDGLSKAIEVSPQTIELGDEVTVVLHTVCTKVGFKKVKDIDILERSVDLTTLSATTIDQALVADALDDTQKKIEERAGVKRLPFGATDDDAPDDEGD